MRPASSLLLCLSLAAVPVLLTAPESFALSGIGVYTKWDRQVNPAVNSLIAATVKDNAVVRQDTLAIGTGLMDALSINTYGTHVAFRRTTGGTTSISVMRVDKKPPTVKQLCAVPDWTGSGEWGGRMDWPRGDWVYYVPRQHAKPSKIYRVNVQTGENQHILTVSGWSYWHCSMTWDGGWLYGGIQDSLENGRLGWFNLKQLLAGSLPVTAGPTFSTSIGGCGHCIGPTAQYQSSNIGTGHTVRIMIPVSSPGVLQTDKEWRFDNAQWNAWSLDTEFDYSAEAMSSFPNRIGTGINHPWNRFSRNSDKWQELQMGWNGRFCGGGANFTVVNPFDSLSLNVSRIPFIGSKDDWVVAAVMHNFWVQSPVEDVCEPLRNDVLQANRDAYWIAGIDSPVAARGMDGGSAAHRRSKVEAVVRDGRVDISVSSQGGTLSIVDLEGRVLHRSIFSGRTVDWAPPRNGTYVAVLDAVDGVSTVRFVVR